MKQSLTSLRGSTARWAAVGASLLSVSLLVACGDDSTDDGSSSGTGGDSSTGGAQTGGASSGGASSGGNGGEAPSTGGLGGAGTGGENLGGEAGGGAETGSAGTGGDGTGGTVNLPAQCTSDVPANHTSNGHAFFELCQIDGAVQHVRIEGLSTATNFGHGSTQLLLGASAEPSVSNPPTGAGELKVLFYEGAPLVDAYFGDASSTLLEPADFVKESTTTCIDIHQGTDAVPPHVVVWVDGQNGADCENFSTLTLASSVGHELWWGGDVTGTVNVGDPAYFRQSGGLAAKVTLFNEPALADATLPPFECETEVAGGAGFVQLCDIDGPVRHVRIDGLLASAESHNVSQVAFGYASAPALPVTIGTGQFLAQFYAGGNGAPPQVAAKFGGKTAAFSTGASFMHTASAVCLDVHDGSETAPPYYVLWVDGQDGADCDDRTTLTLETAFASELSFEDTNGAVDKSAPLFFRQVAAQSAQLTLSSVPAVSDETLAAAATQ